MRPDVFVQEATVPSRKCGKYPLLQCFEITGLVLGNFKVLEVVLVKPVDQDKHTCLQSFLGERAGDITFAVDCALYCTKGAIKRTLCVHRPCVSNPTHSGKNSLNFVVQKTIESVIYPPQIPKYSTPSRTFGSRFETPSAPQDPNTANTGTSLKPPHHLNQRAT